MQTHAGETLLANLAALEEIENEERAEEQAAGPAAEEGTAEEETTRPGQGAPSVENAAAKVLAMLAGVRDKAGEPVLRAANGQNEGGIRPGSLAPPPSATPKGQGQPNSDG
jgi:hypothetical protein